ncbi:MAG: hypothetical protein KAT29_00630 [Anaerolineales bacterium]|nr:hypothetical protein [Anaerolineales bacterium]
MATRVVHSFLSPAYWGSFIALGVNLVLVLVIVYGGIEVEPYKELKAVSGLWDYVYVASVVLVFVFVVRYYSAVAIQTYVGDESHLLKAPKQMKVMLFSIFVALIFLSGLNTFLISYPLLLPALTICLTQTVLSFLCVFAIEVWRWFRPSQIPKSDRNYLISEVMFGSMVLFLMWMINNMPDNSDDLSYMKVPIGGVIVWMVILTIHEWLRLYGKKMKEQFVHLKNALTN